MNYVKKLHIEGFKKFTSLDVFFNENVNILVGENEAGKSTILDALKTVLNQQYRLADKSILRDLFNTDMIEKFRENPNILNLPYIVIEVELVLDPKGKNAEYFFGENYAGRKAQTGKFGIRFECRFDEELGSGLEGAISEGKIPYEYYSLTWITFGNKQYQIIKRPLKLLSIDTTSSATAPSFNYYNRTLFNSKYDEETRAKVKNEFRDNLDAAFEESGLPALSDDRKFGIDSKKVVLESIISVFENSIALENRGSGMESFIKTQIALDRKNGVDVILMEEPENHLCFSNLQKMLKEIESKKDDSQLIITTHNSMIASRLNLKNVLWIAEGEVKSFKDIDPDIAGFFEKADDNAFLQLLLSSKIFLVEGATEYLLLPHFYKQIRGKSIEEDGISIISCNGISYKKYLAIVENTSKKVAVITDNDEDSTKIEEADKFNQGSRQHIFMDHDIGRWTWEICVYEDNKIVLDDIIKTSPTAEYTFKHKSYRGQTVGKMLKNKVETAYLMLKSGIKFDVPQYVEDAIAWINK